MNLTLSKKEIIGIIILLISIILFSLGVYYPLLSTKYEILRIGFGRQEVNIFDSVSLFYNSGDYFIAFIILLFTFILPIYKYAEVLVKKLILKKEVISTNIDKWNMLDVFLVALLLLNFKMNDAFIVMKLEVGTIFIALAVLTRILSIYILSKK